MPKWEKCDECGFLAKNEQGLKVHRKAKHTEPEKFKCFKCDFFANENWWVYSKGITL